MEAAGIEPESVAPPNRPEPPTLPSSPPSLGDNPETDAGEDSSTTRVPPPSAERKLMRLASCALRSWIAVMSLAI